MILLMMAASAALLVGTGANYPVFDAANNMRHVLLPADTRAGTIIYRLRASDADRDYPLTFAATDFGSYVIRIETLPCYVNSSTCSANVFLERSVAAGQLYKFRLTVQDTVGDTTTIAVMIEVTEGSTDINAVFPHIPGVIMVPEDTKIGTELEYVIVRKNPRNSHPASIELWKEVNGTYLQSAPEFRLVQSSKKDTSTGLIKLAQELDYESQTMYRLSIYALDMYAVPGEDSRNIAGFQLVIVVADVQDTPPVWDRIEPITVLPTTLKEGELVLKVTARDGDTGSPRQIKYGLVSEGNPFTVFFSIGRDSGEIRLVRPLHELVSISHAHQPVLLTVLAEEVVNHRQDERSAMSSEATVALLLDELGNTPPYFQSSFYTTMVEENSAQGTILRFDDAYSTQVRDDNMGKMGVFSLSLENNNGTFEIHPNIAERLTDFVIRVRDNSLLDYEINKDLTFKILAQEVAPRKKPLFSSVNVTVHVLDVNDNPPVFLMPHYSASMPENVTSGYQVTTVAARDPDTGVGGLVRYTGLQGHLNTSLSLHPHSGTISVRTIKHGFDREQASEYHFLVEARDNDGVGNHAMVPLTITVLDVNDEAPKFVRDPMDFILDKDGHGFTERAFIKAVDMDAEPPNNIVRYEIVSGNYGDRFSVHGETGELRVVKSVNRPVRQASIPMTLLTVRAYDMGVPTQWSITHVRVYPYSSGARILTFIVPGRPDKVAVKELLEGVTGGEVTVQEVTTFHNYQGPAQDLTHGSSDTEKSVVVATVLYTGHSVIDVDKLQHQLNNRTELVATVGEYQAENRVLFWILLIILLLIALALIILLSCCLCPCCPLFATTRKRSRVHTAENVHFVMKEEEPGYESKAVQAEWNSTERREAWSGDTYTKRSWQFNRRNTRHNEPQRVVLVARGAEGPHQVSPPPPAHPPPLPVSVIYTRDMAQHQDHIILEDVDGTEYRVVQTLPRLINGYILQVLDPSKLSLPVRVEEDPDTESIRRHELDRGSDVAREPADPVPRPRDQMFIRDGNAEILRLVTRGRAEEEDPRLNQPETRPYTVVEGVENIGKQEEEGKEIIMQRFMEDQKKSTEKNGKTREKEVQQTEESRIETDDKKNGSEHDHLLQRVMDTPQRMLSTGEVNRLTMLQRDLLLTKFLVEEQRRTFATLPAHDDTQSLPGMVTSMASMATQTDVNRGTQTETLYTMRPPRRKAKSDLDDSDESDTEDSSDITKLTKKYKKTRTKTHQRLELPERGRSLSRCEIKTPILEETESALENLGDSNQASYTKGAESQTGFTATKSSMLRTQMTRKKLQEEFNTQEQTDPIMKQVNYSHITNGTKRKSVSEQNLHLASTASINNTYENTEQKTGTKSLQSTPVIQRRNFSNLQQKKTSTNIPKQEVSFKDNDSEEEMQREHFDRSKSSLGTRNACTSPIQTYSKRRSSSAERLSSRSDKTRKSPDKILTTSGVVPLENRKILGQSRYMEWYKTKKEERERQKAEEKEAERQRLMAPVKSVSCRPTRRNTTINFKSDENIPRKTSDLKSMNVVVSKTQNTIKQNVISAFQENTKSRKLDDSKIIRSPERKLNVNDLKEDYKQKVFEDDRDSGIAMLAPVSQKMKRKNQNLMEKKSVFTIAYDDMHTKQLRLDSASPP